MQHHYSSSSSLASPTSSPVSFGSSNSSNAGSAGSAGSAAIAESTWTSFLLWDIENEFQNANESYEQCLARNPKKRSPWECIAGSKKEDTLGKSLCLGSRVQKLVHEGQRKYGARFDKGDAACHVVLSAQLLRLQHEVCTPLADSAYCRYLSPVPRDEIIRAARGIRRACLSALQDQIMRFSRQCSSHVLPPPRFSVKFCPFALGLQKDQRAGFDNKIQVRKLNPQDRYDDREICPHCSIPIPISPHSGLPQYRRILFQSHTFPSEQEKRQDERATFACTSCYKSFDDSYAFLEHIFQREIGSQQSCLRRHSTRFSVQQGYLDSNPALVEKCLRNCLNRESLRASKKSDGLE